MVQITQALPILQKEIIIKSLRQREKYLKGIFNEFKGSVITEDVHHELFDITTLIAMLKYDVVVSMTEKESDEFTSKNGVDYPKYV